MGLPALTCPDRFLTGSSAEEPGWNCSRPQLSSQHCPRAQDPVGVNQTSERIWRSLGPVPHIPASPRSTGPAPTSGFGPASPNQDLASGVVAQEAQEGLSPAR